MTIEAYTLRRNHPFMAGVQIAVNAIRFDEDAAGRPDRPGAPADF